MQCQLTNVDEGMLIGTGIVKCVQFHDAISHKCECRKDGSNIGSGTKLGSLSVGKIRHLETVFNQWIWLSNSQLTDAQEGLKTDCIVILRHQV